MSRNGQGRVTGHVRLRRGKNGAVWYARYRLPDGRQRQRKLGFAWEEPGRPPDGYYTKRTAKEALQETLSKARRGELAGMRVTGATFADAAAEFIRFCEQERQIDPDTVDDYRGVIHGDGYLLDEFGDRRLEEIGPDDVDDYKSRKLAEGRLSNRTVVRHLTVCHGIFKRAARVWGLESNPAAAELVQRPRVTYSGKFDCYTGDEVAALAAHADDAQDAAIYVTAAFTGLRQGELLGLRWGDIDLVDALVRVQHNYVNGREKPPKSKKVRSVPLASTVVDRLAALKNRDHFAGDDDLVFCSETGSHLDPWALRRRFYKATERAGLRRLRFHDLRHSFGSAAIRQLDAYTVQSLMGHSSYQTTQRYLHHRPRPEDAQAIERAFGGDRANVRGEPAETPDREQDVRGL